jgi:hypothetical protein
MVLVQNGCAAPLHRGNEIQILQTLLLDTGQAHALVLRSYMALTLFA